MNMINVYVTALYPDCCIRISLSFWWEQEWNLRGPSLSCFNVTFVYDNYLFSLHDKSRATERDYTIQVYLYCFLYYVSLSVLSFQLGEFKAYNLHEYCTVCWVYMFCTSNKSFFLYQITLNQSLSMSGRYQGQCNMLCEHSVSIHLVNIELEKNVCMQ